MEFCLSIVEALDFIANRHDFRNRNLTYNLQTDRKVVPFPFFFLSIYRQVDWSTSLPNLKYYFIHLFF